jgi:hypothetical protein
MSSSFLSIFTLPDDGFLKKSKHVAVIRINKISEYQAHPAIDQTAYTDA